METILLGLAVAALWGSADTLAAKVTSRMGSTATTLIAQVSGLALAGLVALVVGLPTSLSLPAFMESMLSGILLGAIAALAYLTLYKALSYGPLAVASPLVSAQGGVTLLAAIVVLHEVPGTWQLVFLLLTFVGVMLAAVNGSAIRRLVFAHALHTLLSPGVALALVSMLSFGLLAFGLGLAARETDWLLCVVWTRIFSCLLLTVFLPLETVATGKPTGQRAGSDQWRQGWRPWLAGMGATVVGCADVGGLLLLALASTSGSIGVVGMVASAYGVIPLLAGILLFKERPAANQLIGVILLIAGLVGVASPSSPLPSTSGWLLLLVGGSGGVLLTALAVALLARRLRRARRRARAQRLHERQHSGGVLTLPRRRRRRARQTAEAAWTTLWQQMQTLPASQQAEMLTLMQEIVRGLLTLPPDLPPLVAFCGSTRLADDDPLYQAAYETARLLAQAGVAIMVGGQRGIMQAALRGVGESGMLSIGCLLEPEQAEEGKRAGENGCGPDSASGVGADADEAEGTGYGVPEPEPPSEDGEAPDVCLRFRHDLSRQAVMRACAQAFVFFPGGLETLNDLCLTLHAMRTGACPRAPIVLSDPDHVSWSGLLQWLWRDEKREAEAALDGQAKIPRFFLCHDPAEIVGCLLASLFPDRLWLPLEQQQATGADRSIR
jgi:predicted Rossmann-fold nucleotide-binding protein/drug/metabolite transporter (DMT)-like permease